MLEESGEPDIPDKFGRTPAMYAIIGNNLECLHSLINFNCNLAISKLVLEAQLISNYVDVTDSLPRSLTHSRNIWLLRPYRCCFWIDLDVLDSFAT